MPLKLVQGRHGSPFWYIRGSIRGRRVDESTGVSDRASAEDILIKRSAEILHRSIHGDSASRTFAEAALSYMNAGGERAHMAPLLKHFGKTKLGAIGQHAIEGAALKLAPNRSPSTINRQIFTPTVAVLNHAALLGWCSKPVIARPKTPAGRVRWITFEEAARLIEAAAPHLKPLVIFLLCTGARLSEALYLDWRFVDLSGAHVIFANTSAGGVGTKNDESRGVPLHPMAVAALASAPWTDRKGAVFRWPQGRAKALKWAPYASRGGKGGGQVKTAWAAMCERAKITDFTPHDCRHTWATWHYKANKDIAALMRLGGWKSPEMVLRYAHVDTTALAPTIANLWGIHGDQLPAATPKPLTA
jgi:integrase